MMKITERLVLVHLRPLMSPSMDPLQFAYQPGIDIDPSLTWKRLGARWESHRFLIFPAPSIPYSPRFWATSGSAQGWTPITAWKGLWPLHDHPASDGDDRQEVPENWPRVCGSVPAEPPPEQLVVDFHRCKPSPPILVSIQRMDIEMVKSYKWYYSAGHLGVQLNNKLDWTDNTNALHKKG